MFAWLISMAVAEPTSAATSGNEEIVVEANAPEPVEPVVAEVPVKVQLQNGVVLTDGTVQQLVCGVRIRLMSFSFP